MATRTYASLTRVTRRIEALLGDALAAAPFWVRAELSSAHERRGVLYCDLVETRAGVVRAKLRCHVWSSDLAAIRRQFERRGVGLALDDGTEVGIKCRVEFHPVHGLSLRGVDMDPEVALGELERRRREILARLTSADLLARNSARRAPLVPNRIGLITSGTSAGYQDFVHTLHACPLPVDIIFADASVQGEETESSFCRALDCLAAVGVGLVVIIRGGGSRVDLSYLDNEVIARRIADYPVQVWTGIGHETDRSVLDEVAARSFKTPTAVAEEIGEQLVAFARRLDDATGRIGIICRLRIDPERQRVDGAARLIRSAATGKVEVARGILAEREKSLSKTVARFIARHHEALARWREQLHAPLTHQLFARRGGELDALAERLERSAGYAVRSRHAALEHQRARFRHERYQNYLARAGQNHTQWRRALRAADPLLALARGYSLSYTGDGSLIRSVAQVARGEPMVTRVADGVIGSSVETSEESE